MAWHKLEAKKFDIRHMDETIAHLSEGVKALVGDENSLDLEKGNARTALIVLKRLGPHAKGNETLQNGLNRDRAIRPLTFVRSSVNAWVLSDYGGICRMGVCCWWRLRGKRAVMFRWMKTAPNIVQFKQLHRGDLWRWHGWLQNIHTRITSNR